MDTWIQDVRYSARMLVKNTAFTFVAVATLALGIGANTAVFTVLKAVVLQSLPYPGADQLGVVWVDFGEEGQSLPASSSLDFRDYPRMTRSFAGFAACNGATANLTGAGDPE